MRLLGRLLSELSTARFDALCSALDMNEETSVVEIACERLCK